MRRHGCKRRNKWFVDYYLDYVLNYWRNNRLFNCNKMKLFTQSYHTVKNKTASMKHKDGLLSRGGRIRTYNTQLYYTDNQSVTNTNNRFLFENWRKSHRLFTQFILLILITVSSCSEPIKTQTLVSPDKVNVYILSGQSNMRRMPTKPFEDIVDDYGDYVIVKKAWGGQPISKWISDDEFYYDFLLKLVALSTDTIDQELNYVFVWMQGESDVGANNYSYKSDLLELYNLLSTDLGTDELRFVIGRIGDYTLNNRVHLRDKIRDIQVEVAESNPLFDWVDTDDLNTGMQNGVFVEDDIHLTDEGYLELSKRFANKSIQLLENHTYNSHSL